MSLNPGIISIKDVVHYEPCSFSKEKIELGAALILALEGTVKPIVVRRTARIESLGINVYNLVRGDFVYWCALRAYEIDPLRADNIDAYIAENATQEKDLIAQYDLFS